MLARVYLCTLANFRGQSHAWYNREEGYPRRFSGAVRENTLIYAKRAFGACQVGDLAPPVICGSVVSEVKNLSLKAFTSSPPFCRKLYNLDEDAQLWEA